MADVTPILINQLAAQTTLADSDYFIVGGADAKKITVAQMKEALGITALNGNLQGIITAIGYGQDIVDGQSYNILGISAQTQGRWTYYNKNSGSEGLPPDETWGFGLHLGFDNIYIVIFISGTSGKIFHATYNTSWGPWWEH